MADSSITKRALSVALKDLMEQKPFNKISVSEIAEGCNMNRKSFYYHFKDKYDLVNYIFDDEFVQMSAGKDCTETWDFISILCELIYNNRSFYVKAFNIEGQNSFSEHFRAKITPVIMQISKVKLENAGLTDLYQSFFVEAFVGAFHRWLSDTDYVVPEMFLSVLKLCAKTMGNI